MLFLLKRFGFLLCFCVFVFVCCKVFLWEFLWFLLWVLFGVGVFVVGFLGGNNFTIIGIFCRFFKLLSCLCLFTCLFCFYKNCIYKVNLYNLIYITPSGK